MGSSSSSSSETESSSGSSSDSSSDSDDENDREVVSDGGSGWLSSGVCMLCMVTAVVFGGVRLVDGWGLGAIRHPPPHKCLSGGLLLCTTYSSASFTVASPTDALVKVIDHKTSILAIGKLSVHFLLVEIIKGYITRVQAQSWGLGGEAGGGVVGGLVKVGSEPGWRVGLLLGSWVGV